MDYPPRDDHQYPEKPWVQHLAERPRSSATSRNSDKLYGSRIDSFSYMRKGAHHIPSYEEYEGDDNYQYAWNRSSKSTRSPTSPTSPASPLSPTSPMSPMSAASSKRFDPKPVTQRRPSDTSSYLSGRSLYPPPSKPLPPIPPPSSTRRIVSRESLAGSSVYSSHRSRSSKVPSDRESIASFDCQQPVLYQPSEASTTKTEEASAIEVSLQRKFEPNKKKDSSVFYLDVSPSKTVLAAKHGKNSIKVWSLPDEDSCTILKFGAYTEAQCRSREYMIRSHSILSETSNLIAIATKFGTVVEIWDWSKKKSVQSIDKADRWTATHIGASDVNQSVLAVYHGDTSCIDLYGLVPVRKSLTKTRIIDLRLADLPFLMQYPELALSPTSPMLVAAAGPRPPKPGRPPPDRETLLVAWDLGDIGALANQPHMIVRPSQHQELETAIPCELATYGSVVVSIWIPATFRITTVTTPNGGETYNLSTVPVPYRHVLVWDLASNSTRTFRIPNTVSCVSPDCRYVAYCHASANSIGGRGYMAILDVITEQEVWRWPDPDATASQSGPKAGLEQLDSLSKVSDLKFSADGECLFVGDRDGLCCMYKLKA